MRELLSNPLRATRPLLRAAGRLVGPLLACAALGMIGCAPGLECGPGTVQEGDQCVPTIPPVCVGDSVALRDGRCLPSPVVCAPGSRFDLDAELCVLTDAAFEPRPDVDGVPDADPDTPDVEPDAPAGPGCPERAAPGTVCVSGVALDWATNLPVGGAEPVGVLLDDLTLRLQNPTRDPFAQGLLLDGGGFLLDAIPVESQAGPLQQMILVMGGLGQPSTWQRTLTGISAVVVSGQTYEQTPAFLVPSALVTAWDQALDREGERSLATVGFLLVRVLSSQGPVLGATVVNVNPADDALVERYYLGDDLLGLRQDGGTGASGAVLLIGAPVGNYTATAPSHAFTSTLGGTAPGVAITTVILGVVE